jgi:TatD DNase family protein
VIDSHTHLFLCERPEADVVAAAREAGVGRMLNVGLGGDSNATAIAAAERHEGVFATVGCHPTSAGEFDDALGAEIVRLAAHEKVRAIGETGIDYYRETASPDDQRRAFEAQIEIAAGAGLPVVIHARDPDGANPSATDEVFEILDSRVGDGAVILHCFLAPWRVEDAIERGWYCSFSGIVTFPKSDALREAAAKLPDELVLVETDAPYLAPQPVRGRPNEPAHVVSTAEAVAEVRGVSYEELERVVEANAKTVFGW